MYYEDIKYVKTFCRRDSKFAKFTDYHKDFDNCCKNDCTWYRSYRQGEGVHSPDKSVYQQVKPLIAMSIKYSFHCTSKVTSYLIPSVT